MYRGGSLIPTASLVEPAQPSTAPVQPSGLESIAKIGEGLVSNIAKRTQQEVQQERQQFNMIEATNKLKETIMKEDDKRAADQLITEHTEMMFDLQEKHAKGEISDSEYMLLTEEEPNRLVEQLETNLMHPQYKSDLVHKIRQGNAEFQFKESMRILKLSREKSIREFSTRAEKIGAAQNTVDGALKAIETEIKGLDPQTRELYQDELQTIVSSVGREQIQRYLNRNDIPNAKALYNKHKGKFTSKDRTYIEKQLKPEVIRKSGDKIMTNAGSVLTRVFNRIGDKNTRKSLNEYIKKSRAALPFIDADKRENVRRYLAHIERIGHNADKFLKRENNILQGDIALLEDAIDADKSLTETQKTRLIEFITRQKIRYKEMTPEQRLRLKESIQPSKGTLAEQREQNFRDFGLKVAISDLAKTDGLITAYNQIDDPVAGETNTVGQLQQYKNTEEFKSLDEKEQRLQTKSLIRSMADKMAQSKNLKGEKAGNYSKVVGLLMTTESEMADEGAGSVDVRIKSDIMNYDGSPFNIPTWFTDKHEIDDIMNEAQHSVGRENAGLVIMAIFQSMEKKHANIADTDTRREKISEETVERANIAFVKRGESVEGPLDQAIRRSRDAAFVSPLNVLGGAASWTADMLNRRSVRHFGRVNQAAVDNTINFNTWLNKRTTYERYKGKYNISGLYLDPTKIADDAEIGSVLSVSYTRGSYVLSALVDNGYPKPQIVRKLDKNGKVVAEGFFQIEYDKVLSFDDWKDDKTYDPFTFVPLKEF